MAPIFLCILAFATCYFLGRRSLSSGLIAVVAFGYAYGIVRANLRGTFSHFIFDAALVGLYVSQKWFQSRSTPGSNDALRYWVAILIAWPLLICLLPFQTPLVTIVGLRGNTFLIPALILGSRLESKDLMRLAYGLSILNMVALAFAGAEYFLGVERFYPLNEVTATIYASQDVAGYKFFRIPSTFVASAAYAGTMVVTLPFLYGAWSRRAESKSRSLLLLFGVVASLLGVLLGASRSHFIVASAMIVTAVFATRLSVAKQAICMLAILALIVASLSNQRFQRFQSLSDKGMVADRIAGSVNRTFWEILSEYPMGNGLGGGGTSLPYFLQSEVRSPITMENEYARILLEQGVIGLLIWITFIFWAINRKNAFAKNSWQNGRRIAWTCSICYFGTGMIGIGLLTAIPQSLLFLLMVGWIREPQLEDAAGPRFPARRDPRFHPSFAVPTPPRQGVIS